MKQQAVGAEPDEEQRPKADEELVVVPRLPLWKLQENEEEWPARAGQAAPAKENSRKKRKSNKACCFCR